MSWFAIGPAVYAAFAGSLVEFVEALTIVLAVGTIRGWRSALGGTALAVALLVLLLAALGSAIIQIPLPPLQLLLGGLTLLFGLRWLRKAMLRSAGALAPRDETAKFARQAAASASSGLGAGSWDPEALGTTFRVTLIEGIEAVFVVLAVGTTSPGSLRPAVAGAGLALLTVCLLGVLLRRPLARIPDNPLKLGVGICLCGMATFWIGEGASLPWPGGDWSMLALIAGYAATTAATIGLCRVRRRRPEGPADGVRS